MSAILKHEARRYTTGAPKPPPVWQLICEFANGACVCAATDRDDPCEAVRVISQRVRNRVMTEIARGAPAGGLRQRDW